jgi:hypothetical protein
MLDAGVAESNIPLVVDPSRGYRAANLELVQGAYYLATGVWPLVSPATFQAVTGRKRELWQSQTVGALTTVVGSVLAYAGARKRRPSEVALLAIGSAAALAAVEIVYVAKRRIPSIYLSDAAAQLVLMGAWLFGRGHLPWRRASQRRTERDQRVAPADTELQASDTDEQ